jgi:putative Holliday junction resolvase
VRVLALDYGSARCGCAISDPSGTVVTPLDVVAQPATRRGLAHLCAIASEREAELVLVGLPLSLLGSDTAQTRETRAFAARLAQRLGDATPVQMYDERFTTRIAQRVHARPAANEHSRAAAHLLEDWLATRSARTARPR